MGPLATKYPYAPKYFRYSLQWRSKTYPLANHVIAIHDDGPLTYRLGPYFNDEYLLEFAQEFPIYEDMPFLIKVTGSTWKVVQQ